MRHYLPSFNLIANELKRMRNVISQTEKYLKVSSTKNLLFKDSININNLTYYYPGTDKKIIDNVSLQINCKDIVGIVGSSGEGKSTLIDLIAGLLNPSSGNIFVDKVDINKNRK